MRRFLALCLILTCIMPVSAFAETVSAEWPGTGCCGGASTLPFGGPVGARYRAQTFMAGVSGPVISATVRMQLWADQPVSLRIEFYDVDGTDTPIGTALYSEDFTTAHLVQWTWTEATFVFTGDTPILNSDHRYALVVGTAPASTVADPFALNGTTEPVESGWPGGRMMYFRDSDLVWIASDQHDMIFQVVVDEVVSGEPVSFGSLKGNW